MSEIDRCTSDTGRVPPLNLSFEEFVLVHGLINAEQFDTTGWTDEEVDALESLREKLDRNYRSIDTDTDRSEEADR